ncbi:MBL fold metallo-hydrolase [Streptomyces sp. NPDC037389]|uniref:MBL fold metallo-hydrolase n=1 Tax=Streptomyces sp. NPDC037389 TaxID=3155369 RepID=UPI00340A822B
MQTITLGAVEITRIVEWHAPAAASITEIFPGSTPRMWRENESWLAPDFWDPSTDRLGVAVQTWLLRSEGRTILVDTGLGNDKERPDRPVWSRLRGDFLERLAAVGVRPEDVDVVVNTHLHADHVGWNTRLVAGEWVPTFPNAAYLIPRADFDHWGRPEVAAGPAGAAFADSVLPVHRAGQAVLWDGKDGSEGSNGEYRIDGSLALVPAPGHTPGSSVLRLASGTDRAVFVGDLVHSPLQFVEPDCDTCLSEDQVEATRSRRRILEEAADTRSLIFPAHLPGHGAAEVRRDGDKFALSRWAPFASI